MTLAHCKLHVIVACLAAILIMLVSSSSARHQFRTAQQAQHFLGRFRNGRLEELLDQDDYEDFPDVPPIIRLTDSFPEQELLKSQPGKRYLGIDIPDYISTGGKADAIKSMSNKMKAMGRK